MTLTYANPPIVVGIDGSQDGLRAVDWAVEESLATGWPLRLVHAYDPFVRWVPMLPGQANEVVHEEAKLLLEAAREHANNRAENLDTSIVAHLGPPMRVLLDQSESARLLVVGRSGAGLFAELVLGSTSLACATHSRTPVVVVPPRWTPGNRPYRRIVLGVDGAPRSEAATVYAFERAARSDAELVAVMAWELHNPYALRAAALTDEIRHWERQSREELGSVLAPWRARYANVKVTAIAEYAHPVAALTERTDSADLLVVGGRGHGALTGLLLGSVARGILHHAQCPVAVVHAPKSSRESEG